MELSLTSHGVNEYQKCGVEEKDGSQGTNGFNNDLASSITQCPPLCGAGNEYVQKSTHHHLEEAKFNFKANEFTNLMQGNESFLSFQLLFSLITS